MSAPRLDPKDFMVLSRSDELIIRLPGSIAGQDFVLDGLKNCSIFLLDHSEQIQADYIENSELFIAPVNGSFFMRNCTNCVVHVACRQFRARECFDCQIFLYCATKSPVIESSYNITFHPYDIAFPRLSSFFTQCSFPIDRSIMESFHTIYDFSPQEHHEKTHSIIEKNLSQWKEIALEEKYGEIENPLEILWEGKKKIRQTLQQWAAGRGNEEKLEENHSNKESAAFSPRLNQLADSLLDAPDFSSGSSSSAVSHSSIAALLAAKAAAAPSAEFSFTFATSQPEAQIVIDQQEILKSLEEYGEKRQETLKPSTIETPQKTPAVMKSAATPASIDSMWADLVQSEAKPTQKALQKQEKEKARMEEIRLALQREEEERKKKASESFRESEEPSTSAVVDDNEALASELRRLEGARRRSIDDRLQVNAVTLAAIAAEAQENQLTNREIRKHLRAEAEKLMKNSQGKSSKEENQ